MTERWRSGVIWVIVGGWYLEKGGGCLRHRLGLIIIYVGHRVGRIRRGDAAPYR